MTQYTNIPIKRYIIGVSCYIILIVTPFLLIYYAGYVDNHNWNLNAKEISGNITGNYISEINDRCSKRCCGVVNKITYCRPCFYYTCYDGYITIEYTVENDTYNVNKRVYESNSNHPYLDKIQLMNNINTTYPINHTYPIRYNMNNPSDYMFEYKNDKAYFNAAICIVTIGSFLFLSWISVEIYKLFRARNGFSGFSKI